MSEHPYGELVTEYVIYCARCPGWEILEGKTKKKSTEEAKEMGWQRYKGNKKFHWICPTCLKELAQEIEEEENEEEQDGT